MDYQDKKLRLVGAEFGYGAQITETRLAPRLFEERKLHEKLRVGWHEIIDCPHKSPFPALGSVAREKSVIEFNKDLRRVVSEMVEQNYFPIVIGGDHSIALGTWYGASDSMKSDQKLGLIWIDAHLDSHTLNTSPSGAIHGMPVATLLGVGDENIQNNFGKAIVAPTDLVFIGARSYEQAEHDLLQSLGVKIFYMDEINQRGFDAIFKEAVEIISANTDFIGISLDMDVFDPLEVPGVGSPEKGGIKINDVLSTFTSLAYLSNLIAFEVVELNPELDQDTKSFVAGEKLLVKMVDLERI